MTRDLLKAGERYLMRRGGKQVPVIFLGIVQGFKETGNVGADPPPVKILEFEDIKTRMKFTKLKAGSLSRHFDDCFMRGLGGQSCSCRERLQALD